MENSTRILIILVVTVNAVPIVNFFTILNQVLQLDPSVVTYYNNTIRSNIFTNFILLGIFLLLIIVFLKLRERLNYINKELFDFVKNLAFIDLYLCIMYFSWYILTPTNPAYDEFTFGLLVGIVIALLVMLGLMSLINYRRIKKRSVT